MKVIGIKIMILALAVAIGAAAVSSRFFTVTAQGVQFAEARDSGVDGSADGEEVTDFC